MKLTKLLPILTLSAISALSSLADEQPSKSANDPSRYNIVWDSPSRDANGSMPIGNGDIGANVWVEANGDLIFYVSKTDAYGDNGRLLKVGKVRLTCSPVFFKKGDTFTQKLDLKTGRIIINSKRADGEKQLSFWIDANNPIIQIDQKSSTLVSMSAKIELWRTEKTEYKIATTSDLMEDRSKKNKLRKPVFIEPDTIAKGLNNRIAWYHHNAKSDGFALSNKIQGLTEYFKQDPLLHRTFGAVVTGTDATRKDDSTLVTKPATSGSIQLTVLTTHPDSAEQWIKKVNALSDKIRSTPHTQRLAAHQDWWEDFWSRSWIHLTQGKSLASSTDVQSETSEALLVARSYALQRFIDACAGRGNLPIKFNGSIFTAPHKGDPDYRQWGPGYWWQNTRLPYLSMCASGDYELMKPLFKMYGKDIFEVNKFRTKKYLGHGGAFFPECTYFWGSTFTMTYGWTPFEERKDKLQESGWHKWEWVAGPEFVFMMLDYYDYTGDEAFLKETILPVAREVVRFFDEHYKTNSSGELVMHPSMACETWWDCTNPMPELAGLRAITSRLLTIKGGKVSQDDRKFYTAFHKKLAPLPTHIHKDGEQALAPATKFASKKNVENPELYAVFPFRLCSFEKDNAKLGEVALKNRWDSGAAGWRQDDLFMTHLGLTEQARKNLVSRCSNYHRGSRFPAFWGPNYDWIPDQDHGGVMTRALQTMVLQADPYSRKIYLKPALPKAWNCEFKLKAPYNTTIVGSITNGEVKNLKVTPESRGKDIIIVK